MIYRIDKDFDFKQDGQDWMKTYAPTYFQITPQVAWGEGKIPFTVTHRNIDGDKFRNGTVITLDVPFTQLDLDKTLGEILQMFFEHYEQYQGATLVGLTWDQAKAHANAQS